MDMCQDFNSWSEPVVEEVRIPVNNQTPFPLDGLNGHFTSMHATHWNAEVIDTDMDAKLNVKYWAANGTLLTEWTIPLLRIAEIVHGRP